MKTVFDYYDVSEYGVVTNKKNGRVLSVQKNRKGYHYAYVYVEEKRVNFRVSRLVALVYVPNPKNLPEVNHKDGNKDNNHYTNLEWCTGEENREHSMKTGLIKRGEYNSRAKMKDSDVLDVRIRIMAGESFRKVWLDYQDVVKWYTFRDICRGDTWKHIVV
jgi:hypothetical protein